MTDHVVSLTEEVYSCADENSEVGIIFMLVEKYLVWNCNTGDHLGSNLPMEL